jgi:hypothetical protein
MRARRAKGRARSFQHPTNMNRKVKWTLLGMAGAMAIAGFLVQDPRLTLSSRKEESALPPGSVGVTVRENGTDCVVQERLVPCAEIGAHLRDVLKIPSDTPIVVSVEGPHDSTSRARQARLTLLESGFSDVTSVSQPKR